MLSLIPQSNENEKTEDSGCGVARMWNIIKISLTFKYKILFSFFFFFQEIDKDKTENEINDYGGNIFLKIVSYGTVYKHIIAIITVNVNYNY